MTGHGYCCGTFAVPHPKELISVCFHCGRFYDNQTWAERAPLPRTDAPIPERPKRRVFTNHE